MSIRSIGEFRKNAVLHWPEDIRREVAMISVLPLLLETHDSFVSVLNLTDASPTAWKILIENQSKLTAALFVKHLMVLSDLGGEAMNKLTPLSNYFPASRMKYIWNGEEYYYAFKILGQSRTAHNKRIGVTEAQIADSDNELTGIMEDVCMLLMFGGIATNGELPPEAKEKCKIGTILGNSELIKPFVKQNYLRVSRQVQGGTANALGAVTQRHVKDKLEELLPDWNVQTDKSLPNVTHRLDDKGTNFDVTAVSPGGMQFGIEVSFQVTTNSTIERKAREASSVRASVHAAGHKVCYVIDGAGNILVRA